MGRPTLLLVCLLWKAKWTHIDNYLPSPLAWSCFITPTTPVRKTTDVHVRPVEMIRNGKKSEDHVTPPHPTLILPFHILTVEQLLVLQWHLIFGKSFSLLSSAPRTLTDLRGKVRNNEGLRSRFYKYANMNIPWLGPFSETCSLKAGIFRYVCAYECCSKRCIFEGTWDHSAFHGIYFDL
jgi:hypothetical protein